MIEIINYERVNKNKIIGFADILIPAMAIPKTILRRIAHLQSGEKQWFNLPTYQKERADGSPQYLKYWQFETEAYNAQLLESLLDKVKKYCIENKIAEIEPLNFKPLDFTPESELPF